MACNKLNLVAYSTYILCCLWLFTGKNLHFLSVQVICHFFTVTDHALHPTQLILLAINMLITLHKRC